MPVNNECRDATDGASGIAAQLPLHPSGLQGLPSRGKR